MLGLGQQVPPQIGVAQIDVYEGGHHIVINGSSWELIETAGKLATLLKGFASRNTPSKSGSIAQGAGAGKPPPPVLGQSTG
eukprot:12913465-Prorocentrum_lima.AAC.1